jgi:predicted transposase YbfD/YdcC
MHNITLVGLDSTYPSFDILELMAEFEDMKDQRKAQGIRYKLSCLLVMILLARLAGETKPSGIADWLKLRKEQLVTLFNLKHGQVPSLNTIRRTLAETIVAQELQKVVVYYLHDKYGGDESEQVVLDGKTMRGTIPKGEKAGVHLLSAYLPEGGVVQDQIEVEAKENEIIAAPRLLAKLNLKGKVVSGDAMFTQRKLSVQVTAQGGDYLWFVKDNQPTLLADVQQFFQPPRKASGWHIPLLKVHEATSVDKGHGRIEQRRIRVAYDETEFLNWPNAKLVFILERKVTHMASGLISVETAYGISSLAPHPAMAQQLLNLARAHWGIENGLHYRRDVTLNEDATRMKNTAQAEAVAIFNNFIVGLAQKLGFSNLAYAIRHFNAQLNVRLAQLALPS